MPMLDPIRAMWRDQSIDILNDFLREERAAVARYQQVLETVGQSFLRGQLVDCYRSHQQRVMKLVERIRSLGGHPSIARPRGQRAAVTPGDDRWGIVALEANEDYGLQLYLDHISRLDPTSRRMLEQEVLPEQIRTHQSVSELRLHGSGLSP